MKAITTTALLFAQSSNMALRFHQNHQSKFHRCCTDIWYMGRFPFIQATVHNSLGLDEKGGVKINQDGILDDKNAQITKYVV